MSTKDETPSDAELIERLGGVRALTEKLGYPIEGGLQRVQNWVTRGIPSAVKLERPDLFLPHLYGAGKQAAHRKQARAG